MSGLCIGTSGWVYRHWNGLFYPPDLPAQGQLAFYARHFSTVEVNYSFYHLPARAVFEGWRQQTPPDFLFAVKASRYLTHLKKLKEPREPLQRLLERASGLGPKLGPLLFQFPHTWPANYERLEGFVEALSEHPGRRYAFEFRHRSWLEPRTYALLEQLGAALCLPVSPGLPLDLRLTASWTYVRFHSGRHGVGFESDELGEWADRLRGYLQRGVDVYAYFNNDPDGHALADARRLRELLVGSG